MTACANHININYLVWIKVLTVCGLRFINYSSFLALRGSLHQKFGWLDQESIQSGRRIFGLIEAVCKLEERQK